MSLREEYVRRLEGQMTDIRFHLPYLNQVACSYPEVQVLELGVRDCNSTAAFLAAAEEVGGFVRSVDLKEPKIPERLLAEWVTSERWQFVKANSLTVGIEPDVLFDVIFLDTSHLLYDTLIELRRLVPLVKPGGKFLLHDTEWTGLTVPDANHMLGSKGWGPVAWALDWYCDWERTDLTWINHPGSFGLGEICL